MGNFPEIDLAIACGSGTYIRAIARDLGEKLKCGATLSGLERTFSNGFDISNSITFEAIAPLNIALHIDGKESHDLDIIDGIIPPEIPLKHLGIIELTSESARRWTQGQALSFDLLGSDLGSDLSFYTPPNIYRRVYTQAKFLGIGEIQETQKLIPVVVFPSDFN
jgi:tRNA pseudouridine55 synthase